MRWWLGDNVLGHVLSILPKRTNETRRVVLFLAAGTNNDVIYFQDIIRRSGRINTPDKCYVVANRDAGVG